MRKIDIAEVTEYIAKQGPETKIYLGADSERYRRNEKWYADYTLAIVVHIDGCHGCKIFGEVQTEVDYDAKAGKPSMRLMNEVYKVAELYHKLVEADVIGEKEVQIHLDINPKECYNSSIVIQQAVGYIKGMCNVVPMVKPNAFAASYAADRLKEVMAMAALAA
jgi:predicted RNase H-related nuclease YkuK (DUF458 family)